jgi:hypothetical protein
MRRNVVAAAAQVVGMTVAITGAFALSVGAGLLAAGTCLFLVGYDLEAG